MLELHTAKLDSLCADGTKLSKKKQYLGQTKFEYSIGISVSIQIYVKQCIFLIGTCRLDTIQDFLCKLGMKPHVHLVKISIFPLSHVIDRPTKIIKDTRKAST